MATTTQIQILSRIGASGAPPSLISGELAYNQPDTATPTNPGDALYCGDGVNVNLLVGADRQVELAGAQTITGPKTIAITNLKIPGGGANYLLETDGAGNLNWTNAPGGGLTQVATDGITLSGIGTVGQPLSVVPDTVAVKSDGVTISGTGVTASPLAAIKWPVVVDGTTITGTGLTGSPLTAVAGSVAVVTNATIAGNGTTASPLGVVTGTVPVVTTGSMLSGNGTTGNPLGVVPNSVPVATNSTLTGNGTTANPLGVVGGQLANTVPVSTNTTLTGNGTTASPLGVVASSLADAVPVLTDGATLTGTGVTGTPLSIRQVYTNTTLSGAGTPASPLAVVPNSVAITTNATLTGNGTTATPLALVTPVTLQNGGTGVSAASNAALLTALGAAPISINTYGTTAPTSPVTGALWWNPSTSVLQMWTGTAWVTVVPGPQVVTEVALTGDASGGPAP